LRLWEGETTEILDGVTLINTGGHFEGSIALHWAAVWAARDCCWSAIRSRW